MPYLHTVCARIVSAYKVDDERAGASSTAASNGEKPHADAQILIVFYKYAIKKKFKSHSWTRLAMTSCYVYSVCRKKTCVYRNRENRRESALYTCI